MTNAGRVSLVDKGPFSPNTSYKRLDFVSDNDELYICKQPCTGIATSNTAYWTKMVDKRCSITDSEWDTIQNLYN